MRILLRQLTQSFFILCARPRTYVGFATILFLDLVLLGMLQVEHLREAARAFYLKGEAYSAPENFSCLTIAHLTLKSSLEWLGSLFPALVAGDIVAKEVEEGTMRMTLSRPVSRTRALAMRWLNCAAFACALALFSAAVALLCGLIDTPPGNLLIAVPDSRERVLYPFTEGLLRFATAVPLQALALVTIASFAFLFSCCDMKPLAATGVALAILYADRFFFQTQFFKVFRPWFLTSRIDGWLRVYEKQIPWDDLLWNAAILGAASIAFAVAGLGIFARRDLKP